MRILLNGASLAGRVTGVGHYGLRLLRELMTLPVTDGIEGIGVFDGREVHDAGTFLSHLVEAGGVPRHERLKSVVRQLWPSCRDWADRIRRWHLRRETRHAQWHLFHEPNFVSPQFDLPLVTTIHDMSYLRYPRFLPKDRLTWLRRKMSLAIERSRVILVDSHFTRRELLELCPQVPGERVHVTHLGVDLAYFSDPRHEVRLADVRHRLALPERFVLYLGTLEPRKNLQGLIEAYGRLPAALQASHPLVLAGMSGWQQSYFRGELEKLRARGVLQELGYVAESDVPALMRAATAFCFPSLYEGFGLPPLEAAACGTPVLSSKAASLPEVLGDAAVYVDPRSPDDIAGGLLRILEDEPLRLRLRAAGPARAAQFPWSNCARQTLNAYRLAA